MGLNYYQFNLEPYRDTDILNKLFDNRARALSGETPYLKKVMYTDLKEIFMFYIEKIGEWCNGRNIYKDTLGSAIYHEIYTRFGERVRVAELFLFFADWQKNGTPLARAHDFIIYFRTWFNGVENARLEQQRKQENEQRKHEVTYSYSEWCEYIKTADPELYKQVISYRHIKQKNATKRLNT